MYLSSATIELQGRGRGREWRRRRTISLKKIYTKDNPYSSVQLHVQKKCLGLNLTLMGVEDKT